MSSLGQGAVLGLQHFERVQNPASRLTRLDYTINVTSLGSLKRVGESTLVVGSLFDDVLATEDDLDCTLGTHDGDLACGPGVVEVALEVLGGHNVVSTTVGLACDEGDLGHGRLSVSVKQLSTVLDDTSEFLGSTWKEAWHIGEGDDRDLEGITEADEASSFDGSVDVETASKDLRLVGNDTYDATFDLREASNHVLGVAWHNLVEVVAVADTLDHGEHVVGLVGVVRNDVVK